MPRKALSRTLLTATVALGITLASALASPSPVQAALPDGISLDKSSGCHFFMPKGWSGRVVEWLGPCVESLANGYGVLKLYERGKLNKAYYGLAEDGAMTLGALVEGSRVSPGSFKNGVMEKMDDRFLTVTAYNNAIDAAREVSKTLEARGNIATSKYYKDMADKLSKAID